MFEDPRGSGYIASSALRTELTRNRLSGDSSKAAGSVNGAVLVLDGNTFTRFTRLGRPARRGAGVRGCRAVAVHGNTLIEPAGSVPMLRNWGGIAASASDNTVPDGLEAVSDNGAAYHRLRSRLAAWRSSAREAAGLARHQVAVAARGLGLIR